MKIAEERKVVHEQLAFVDQQQRQLLDLLVQHKSSSSSSSQSSSSNVVNNQATIDNNNSNNNNNIPTITVSQLQSQTQTTTTATTPKVTFNDNVKTTFVELIDVDNDDNEIIPLNNDNNNNTNNTNNAIVVDGSGKNDIASNSTLPDELDDSNSVCIYFFPPKISFFNFISIFVVCNCF